MLLGHARRSPYPRLGVRSRASLWCVGLIGFGLALGRLAAAGPQPDANSPITEHQVKAAFLYNFAKFVTWPSDANFTAPTDSLIIGAVGSSPVGDFLRGTAQGRVVRGHPVGVHLFRSPAEIGPCHILYAGQTDPEQVDALLRDHNWNGVLTVGETDRFLELGGAIRFVVKDNRVGFVVNVAAVAHNSLEVGAGMLKVAHGVVSTPAAEAKK